MSRIVDRRLIVTGTLRCTTPLHVGGVDGRPGADLTLSVNGKGRHYIPGTGLAGPMRGWCRETFGKELTEDGEKLTDRLWGYQVEGDAEAGEASHIVVEDAIVPDDALAPEIRDGVGIDRYTGAAAGRIKFSREVLPAGTVLSLRMVVDVPRKAPATMDMVAGLLQAMQAGEIGFGAGRSRGLGRVVVEDLKVAEQSLADREGILALLKGGPAGTNPSRSWPVWKSHRRIRPLITIAVKWHPVGPMMVKASADGMTVDTLPLMSRHRDGALRLVLPGSSGKGALRTQAERIVTTLLGTPAAESMTFLAQLDRHALVETLFGSRNDPGHDADAAKGNVEDQDGPPLPGLSALAVADCFWTAPLQPDTWDYLLGTVGAAVNDVSAFAASLPEYGHKGPSQPYLDPAMHVAIDRWTGGAAEGALFSVLEPWAFEWEPLELTVDPRRLARRHDDRCGNDTTVALAAFGLLLLTLRDLAGGEVPLGFAGNRGFGAVEVESIDVKVPEEQDWWDDHVRGVLNAVRNLSGPICEGGRLTVAPGRVPRIEQAWQHYLEKHGLEAAVAAAGAGA